MDEYTRRAIVDLCRPVTSEGEIDLQLEDRLARLELFDTLDGIFQAFLDTNVHLQRHFSLSELLDLTDKCYFRYEHYSVPYRGTVTTIRDDEAVWRCIKLANNGFLYSPKGGARISRHKYRTWVQLDYETGFKHFSRLYTATSARFDEAKAFYTFEERRVDVKLYPKAAGDVHLMITWEDGYPDYTASVQRATWRVA